METSGMAESFPAINLGWMFMKMFGALGLLLLLMWVLVKFVVPLLTRRGYLRGQEAGLISVVQRFALEPRKNLYLIEVAGQRKLVGTSEKSIEYLGEVTKSDSIQT